MSRKSRPEPSPPATPSAPLASAAGGHLRRTLFIAAALLLLLAFAVAAFVYRSANERSAQQAALANQPALSNPQAPAFGNPAARVHIVEFFDPACETCAAFFPHVKRLLAAHPDRIRLSLRHVPFHDGSELVVRILEAARAQDKYLPTLQTFYAEQGRWAVEHVVLADRVWQTAGRTGLDLERLQFDMTAPELARRMAQDAADARALGVTKTPTFFVNGRPLPRFGLQELQDLVQEELRLAYP